MKIFTMNKIALLAGVFIFPAYGQVINNAMTPAIPGVVGGGVGIELIKDGFDGTEGPIGLADGSFLFTETRAERIVHIAADNTVSTFLDKSNGANGLAFNKAQELYAVQVLKPAVGIIHPPGHEKVLATEFDGKPLQRPNDIVIDKTGGIYFTDSGINATAENPHPTDSRPAVYYLGAAGELKQLATDIGRPNGIQLSPDERTLYVADTLGEYVLSYDIAANGATTNRKNFARLTGWQETATGGSSGADGLAVDNEGKLYVASNAGIEVFNEGGTALGVIAIPQKPQNLAFAGTDKAVLYVVGRGAVYKFPVLTAGYRDRAK